MGVRRLLQKYQLVFANSDMDLDCTPLISHDIPLLDLAALKQRYRWIPHGVRGGEGSYRSAVGGQGYSRKQ